MPMFGLFMSRVPPQAKTGFRIVVRSRKHTRYTHSVEISTGWFVLTANLTATLSAHEDSARARREMVTMPGEKWRLHVQGSAIARVNRHPWWAYSRPWVRGGHCPQTENATCSQSSLL